MRTRLGWGEASTLVIHKDHLILPWDQEDQSYLYSLNPKTGDIQWKVERDEPSNWSTPLITTHADRTQLIVNGTHRARSYFLNSGEVVWECGELSVNAIPSPLRYKDTILCISGYRKSIVYAIPVDARGDISGTDRIRWIYNQNTPYVASPVIVGNKIFLTKQRTALVTVLDLDTGKPLIEAERLHGLREVYASPIVANDKVYLVDRQGTTAVLKYDGELKILAVNKLGVQIDASPAVVGNQLFLRSWSALYCIEE
ncbi:MAG TPA: hypothetical protein EYQ50_21565 [Verrucomicrobiales bacterium]|nr:hypothetical protein [Verrucomicrobiales bacterium]